MIKNIEDLNIENKKVIIRCDFNVPIENGKIIDEKPGTNKSPIYAKSSEISHFIRINSTIIHITIIIFIISYIII